MSFAYTSHASSSNSTVANGLAQDLDKFVLSPSHIRVAKLAISDQSDGDARGILYYWEGDNTPSVTQNATAWSLKQFSPDDTTDYDEAYRHAMEFLNGDKTVDGVTLTLQQAASAQVGMANRKKGTFRVTVFYPIAFTGSPQS